MGLIVAVESPAEWAERTAREQGLPGRVEDRGVLLKVAALLTVGRESARRVGAARVRPAKRG
jgi:hypothetical protein